jgi:hypothetical protein
MRPERPNNALEPMASAPRFHLKFTLAVIRAVAQLWIVRPLKIMRNIFTINSAAMILTSLMTPQRASIQKRAILRNGRFGLGFAFLLCLCSGPAWGASFVGFNQGQFYSILGTTASPTTPIPLYVQFDGPVFANTFVSIDSSDPGSLTVEGGGVMIPAGQSTGTVLLTAVNESPAVTLTASYAATTKTTSVSVVSAIPTYTLTLATNGNGTVTNSSSGSSFPPGTVVTLTATPGVNRTFAGWSGNAAGTMNPLSVAITNNMTITANFVYATNSVQPSIALAAQVSWFAATNQNYQVQAAEALATNSWFDLGPLVPGNDKTNHFYDPLGANRSRFYRVMTRP